MYAYYAVTGLIPRHDAKKTQGTPTAASTSCAQHSTSASSVKRKKTFIDKVKAAAAVTITPLQILQMILGSYAIFHTHSVCPDKEGPVFTIFGGVMYISYLALFIDMFKGKIKTFFGGKSSAVSAKDDSRVKSE
jgi:hypothetical protein